MIDFHKVAGILIKDRRLLVTREKKKEFFVSPGGAVEGDESLTQALIRELLEEIGVEVNESELEFFRTFFAKATGQESKTLRMDVFLVKRWKGNPHPCSGDETIEKIRWVQSKMTPEVKIGSIFEHEVIPRIKEKNLID